MHNGLNIPVHYVIIPSVKSCLTHINLHSILVGGDPCLADTRVGGEA